MDLKQYLAILEGCMRAMEAIPEEFYSPADADVQLAYEHLDEATMQLRNAVEYQDEMAAIAQESIDAQINNKP